MLGIIFPCMNKEAEHLILFNTNLPPPSSPLSQDYNQDLKYITTIISPPVLPWLQTVICDKVISCTGYGKYDEQHHTR